MSCVLDFHNIKKLPEQSLAVTQCGWSKCMSGHHSQPRLYPHYSVTFILRGSGTYTTGNRTFSLHAGQGFIILPGALTSYTADTEEPWQYIYAIFRGVDSDSLIRNAGLSGENVIFDFPLDEEMFQDLRAMYECSRSYEARGYDVTGRFLLVMSRLVREAGVRRRAANIHEAHLARAMEYIEDNYPYSITVQDIADAVCIDRTYLFKLFKSGLGRSPIHVLNDRRLARAKELLDNSDITVSEVALSTGFYDLSHFNRAFSAAFGMTPGQYRKRTMESEV